MLNSILDSITNFFRAHGTSLIWIAVLLVFARVVLQLMLDRIVQRMHVRHAGRKAALRENRAKTLAHILNIAGKIIIYTAVILMVLNIAGIDTTPLLASAGVAGFAIGFGMQAIVKDFIAGILIFFENQYAVGDRVKIGDFEGTVHTMNVRSTVLKDDEENFVFIPNGSITQVVNLSLKNYYKQESEEKNIKK